MLTNKDIYYIHLTIQLAKEAQKAGNLPIGALIILDDEIIAEGKNSIWTPKYRPNRHAEIEALESVPAKYWGRASNMTLYTTLEPCLMCLGTILVHRVGRIVFGAKDKHGGAMCVFGHMPKAFETLLQSTTWDGPALLEECDELSKRVIAMSFAHKREKGSNSSLWDVIIDEDKE